jgi:NNP family nitrate/nitrite transporter-like MFS transporter
MFSSNVVGTANAIAGGWGNMGGGLTYLVMPQLFNLFNLFSPAHVAWRVASVVPALICVLVGLLDYFIVDDCPEGDWIALKKAAKEKSKSADRDISEVLKVQDTDEKAKNVDLVPAADQSSQSSSEPKKGGFLSVMKNFGVVLKDPVVLILILQYACTFGLELAVDNMIGEFFTHRFKLDQTKSGLFGSIFGLMNLFSRASGGFFADWLNARIGNGVVGRILAQQLIIFFEGIALIAFSFSMAGSLEAAIAVMVLFSYFVQAGCGTTFSLAPFVNRTHYGILTGLIGAGGNVGGVIFNAVFKAYGENFEGAYMTIGITVLTVSLLSMVSKVEGKMLYMLFTKK